MLGHLIAESGAIDPWLQHVGAVLCHLASLFGATWRNMAQLPSSSVLNVVDFRIPVPSCELANVKPSRVLIAEAVGCTPTSGFLPSFPPEQRGRESLPLLLKRSLILGFREAIT